MKVVNLTRWNTQHLRAIAARVAQEHLTAEQRARLIVTIKYNRSFDRGWCSGHCPYNIMRPTVMVPSKVVDKIDLAHVVAHELAHAKGWHHRDFSGQAIFNRVGNWREIYAWADTMPLELQAAKKKVKANVEFKIDHARKMIARWTSKQKRATTGVKAWTRRLKYFERKQAAMNTPIDSQI